MSNEIRVRAGFEIRKVSAPASDAIPFIERTFPTDFSTDMDGVGGPTPGQFLADVAPGTDVDLTELDTPGVCRLENMDQSNFVTYGIFDTSDGEFHPIGEIRPGEFWPIRLSRYLGLEYGSGTGTGSIGSGKTLRIVADTAPCKVEVAAYEA